MSDNPGRQERLERFIGSTSDWDPADLPVGSVVLDSHRVAWQRTFSGSWRSTLVGERRSQELAKFGPLTVLHNPQGGEPR